MDYSAMPLNIKNEIVYKLAVNLATETGQSITDAVGGALEASMAEITRKKQRVGMANRLMEVGRRAASHAPKEWLAKDWDAELYDEQGLPR